MEITSNRQLVSAVNENLSTKALSQLLSGESTKLNINYMTKKIVIWCKWEIFFLIWLLYVSTSYSFLIHFIWFLYVSVTWCSCAMHFLLFFNSLQETAINLRCAPPLIRSLTGGWGHSVTDGGWSTLLPNPASAIALYCTLIVPKPTLHLPCTCLYTCIFTFTFPQSECTSFIFRLSVQISISINGITLFLFCGDPQATISWVF